METRINKTVEFRFNDDKRTLVGYSALFNSYSEDLGFREIITPGAFAEALLKSDVRALFNHDINFVLGRTASKTLRLKEDSKGLYSEIDMPDTDYARNLTELIKRGDISQQSFSFMVDKDGQTWKYDQEIEGKKTVIRIIRRIKELYDVSIVTIPAYLDTTVALRCKNEDIEDRKLFQELLKKLRRS